MLEPYVTLLATKMDINVDGTIAIIGVAFACVICFAMKGLGSFLAYTEFGNNQVRSFFGLCLYKSAEFVSVVCCGIIVYVIKLLM